GVALPSSVTGPVSRWAPWPASRGPLGHRRKTSRSVCRSGVNRTVRVPCTAFSPGRTSMASVYCDRSARGSARGGVGGHDGTPGCAAAVVVVVLVDVLVVDIDVLVLVVLAGAAALWPDEQLVASSSAATVSTRVTRTMPCWR